MSTNVPGRLYEPAKRTMDIFLSAGALLLLLLLMAASIGRYEHGNS